MRRLLTLAAVLAPALLAGCDAPRSQVHGTIKYQGAPLSRATIVFQGPDNRSYPVPIMPDGSYKAASLPRGHIRVALIVSEPRVPPRPAPGKGDADAFADPLAQKDDAAKGRGRRPASKETASELPPRYNNPNTSGLSFELEAPVQEYSPRLE
jgi:hypothetical protein